MTADVGVSAPHCRSFAQEGSQRFCTNPCVQWKPAPTVAQSESVVQAAVHTDRSAPDSNDTYEHNPLLHSVLPSQAEPRGSPVESCGRQLPAWQTERNSCVLNVAAQSVLFAHTCAADSVASIWYGVAFALGGSVELITRT